MLQNRGVKWRKINVLDYMEMKWQSKIQSIARTNKDKMQEHAVLDCKNKERD